MTTGSNLEYQQRLDARRLAMVVLTTTSWPRIQHAVDAVDAVDAVAGAATAATPGSSIEVAIP